TDLTGLTAAEATSLLAGPGRLESPALAAAMRKVAAALPDAHRAQAMRAAHRVLVRPEGFIRSPVQLDALGPVQQAVFDGRRIRVRYRRPDQAEPTTRVLDPVGLIVAGEVWYLVANADGRERMYRLSRMSDVAILDEPARRADDVDLEAVWQRRRAEFRGGFEPVEVLVECSAADRALLDRTPTVRVRSAGAGRVWVTIFGRDRVVATLWKLAFDGDYRVVGPDWVRDDLRQRATRLLAGLGDAPV
ncbi:MAG: WYL domain-containing protein, partial [Gordonia sp. (in: high G+C Gram-positive bacteria)]